MATRIYFGRAKKDYPDNSIKKGQLYYSWSLDSKPFRSLKPPRPSQITTSENVANVRIARETLEDIIDDVHMGGWRTTNDSIVDSMFVIVARMQDMCVLCMDSARDMKELFSRSYAANKMRELSDCADSLALQLEELTDEMEADNNSIPSLLERAHALPKWELF